MNMRSCLLLGAAISALISGCATFTGPGDKQADVPPRLIMRDGVKAWDNPSAFGPVPAQVSSMAQQACGSLNTKDAQFKASGYHAKAVDLDGRPLKNGGFYCVPK